MIVEVEARGDVELLSVGIGFDLSRYYRHSSVLKAPEQLAGAVVKALADRLCAGAQAEGPVSDGVASEDGGDPPSAAEADPAQGGATPEAT